MQTRGKRFSVLGAGNRPFRAFRFLFYSYPRFPSAEADFTLGYRYFVPSGLSEGDSMARRNVPKSRSDTVPIAQSAAKRNSGRETEYELLSPERAE